MNGPAHAASGSTRALAGSVALVTGAGRGIGRATAAHLAADGARVLLASRTAAELADAVNEITAAGGDAAALVCDVTRYDATATLIRAIPRLDILVNCAGTNVPQSIEQIDEATYDTVMDLNVKALVFASQAAAEVMRSAGRGGSIINVSSQMGHVGAVRRGVYCASKHAVEGFTKALALELAGSGIRVNSVAPTFVETPMTAPFLADPAFRTAVLDNIPLGRLGNVDEVAAAIVFLASPSASLITGTSLVIDGGWTAR